MSLSINRELWDVYAVEIIRHRLALVSHRRYSYRCHVCECGASDDVSDLLAAIKASNPFTFAGIDDIRVKLYLATQNDGEWFDADAPQTTALMEGVKATVDAICQTDLNQQDLLEQHFHSLETRKIHLLVRAVDAGKPLIQLIAKSSKPRSSALTAASVHGLQKAIKKELFDSNPFIRAIALQLYEAKNANDEWLARTRAGPGINIFSLIERRGLNVLVVLPQTSVVAEDKEHWHHTQHYWDVAKKVKTTKEVDKLVKRVQEISRTGARDAYKTPFIILENSSGSGKTQMAFDLMTREETEVFHISCRESGGDVELAHSSRSSAFLQCVTADLPSMDNAGIFIISKAQESYTLGFIETLLTSRSAFTEPRTRRKVIDALKTRQGSGRHCVFFLDNFLDSTREHSARDLRLMKNVFRSLGLAVIVSSRSCVGSEIMGSDQHCVKQQDHAILTSDGQPQPTMFANAVMEYATENPLKDDRGLVEYPDEMIEELANKFATSEKFGSEYLRMGQVCLSLGGSYAKDRSWEMVRGDIKRHLTTDHFAHLDESEPYQLWFPWNKPPPPPQS
ncbi:hypothetical protein GQ600_16697 [Phytophthora cactorum]|nr:hypothetical protein GQ600_16697 [Phytophthora cactorum]